VSDADGVERLRGVFSWVAAGLDQEVRSDQAHFDLDANIAWASKKLEERIYKIDQPPESASS
jgi:hypothetical protein